jgi:hypothetical protein
MAFIKCTFLAAIALPASIKEISSYAFADCGELTTIIVPESVEKIEVDTYYGNIFKRLLKNEPLEPSRTQARGLRGRVLRRKTMPEKGEHYTPGQKHLLSK